MLSEVRLEILHLELFKQPALDGLFSTRFSIAIEYDNTIVRTSLYPLLHNGIDFVKTGCFVIPYDLDCMSERAVKIEITGFEEKETYQAVL